MDLKSDLIKFAQNPRFERWLDAALVEPAGMLRQPLSLPALSRKVIMTMRLRSWGGLARR